MGSILNFVFPYPKDDIFDWCMTGPITNYIQQYYPHTFDMEIKKDSDNIIVIEAFEKFKGFLRNYNHVIKNGITILDYFKNQKNKIIITSIADPATNGEKKDIVKLVNEHNLQDRVYFIESNFRHQHHKNTYCWNFFLEEQSRTIQHIYKEDDNKLGYQVKEIEIDELNTFRNKKFLSFNRTLDRAHRLSLFYDYLNNDFSDSYFSFLVYNSKYESLLQFEPSSIDLNDFHKHLPIELDTQTVDNKQSFRTSDALGKKEFYLDSCINIVTETSFIDNELFVSEKIVKPILNYQPFIVVGPFKYLEHLKSLGFKTFSAFWDESYDDIENPKERYIKIRDLILEINSKSIEEVNEIYQNTKEICIHNRKNFVNLKSTIDEFINFGN